MSTAGSYISFKRKNLEIRMKRSIRNRFLSIVHDSQFIDLVLESYPNFKCVVNERCGTWYVKPVHAPFSAYFKSTDGHTGQWSFSTRRLNLHLLDLIHDYGGIVLVDSTRRGKRMPDALSKTVPIWIATLNKCVFERLRPHDLENRQLVFFPPYLPETERSAMNKKLDGFVDLLMNSGINLDFISSKLQKPIRPLWATPTSTLSSAQFEDYHTVVLVTASKQVHDGYSREYGFLYVQGAADDEEEWASGLSPTVFWNHADNILSFPEEEYDSNIKCLLSKISHDNTSTAATTTTSDVLTYLVPTNISIGDRSKFSETENKGFFFIVNFSSQPLNIPQELHCPIESGKKGAQSFRKEAPKILSKLNGIKPPWDVQDSLILLDDQGGKEIASCFALLLLSLYYDSDLRKLSTPLTLGTSQTHLDKHQIRQRLIKIIEAHPKTNPSRAFLIAVNTLLLSTSS
ncbi:initiator methionine tRNA 2'-O-ribosyl phosphate transferase [Schizosaccharomyces octosporus yFS286]|uniref:Initiator methionine tRNA 2'-O-ribosyl phosphate transferase n=1 Tax=Schizosaccharomyces octosporus (strain yFS286) TaxID=483514 RepID=S9PUA3_SCHOY|nr:initiator methionine tRNA 2'-O-ribosyl phosphate transferase [Schizosaccharomyces octosporus yFS286]EPX71537.1 initiator methionine tRNA 2'-O-ribosyl phosphate transferase [Schizosaccharomyces octosporus yFS286]